MELSAAVIERVFSGEPSSPPQAQLESLSGDKCLLLRRSLSPDLGGARSYYFPWQHYAVSLSLSL